MSGSSSESTVERGYIEIVLDLPWNKKSVDNKDLDHAEQVLNDDHYGLKDVKGKFYEAAVYEECNSYTAKADEYDKKFPYMMKLKMPWQWNQNNITKINKKLEHEERDKLKLV